MIVVCRFAKSKEEEAMRSDTIQGAKSRRESEKKAKRSERKTKKETLFCASDRDERTLEKNTYEPSFGGHNLKAEMTAD
jgi:hypothetical protein